jgi:hypothetical protein
VEDVMDNLQGQTMVMDDVEAGSWYENYTGNVINHGWFNGYKDSKGNLTNQFGPADNVTREQILKVMYELAIDLEMGTIGTSGCDPETVSLDDSQIEWTNDSWSTGYIQCIYNSGVEISLLEDIVQEEAIKLRAPAYRWEVIMTAFEMLGVNSEDYDAYTLSDLETSALSEDVKNFIQTAIDAGIISGYPDGTFKPDRWINRAEMAKILTLLSEVYS